MPSVHRSVLHILFVLVCLVVPVIPAISSFRMLGSLSGVNTIMMISTTDVELSLDGFFTVHTQPESTTSFFSQCVQSAPSLGRDKPAALPIMPS